MKATFVVVNFIYYFGLTCHAGHWSYLDESHWSGKCNVGSMQSPIDIISSEAIIDVKDNVIQGPLVFQSYQKIKTNALNNGHTLQWNKVSESGDVTPPMFSGGPLSGTYDFLQLHIHWISEHSIDSMKYPMELHLVHVKSGLSVNQALQRPDGIAVIAILFQVLNAPDGDMAMRDLLEVVPSLLTRTKQPVPAGYIDLSRILSPDPQTYYTYHGSLTTPNCSEVVTWIVMDVPSTITDYQYKTLTRANVGGVDNYRSVQAINNRVVYRTASSCATMVVPSLLTIVNNMIACSNGAVFTAIIKVIFQVVKVKKKLFGNIVVKQCSGS